MVSKVLISVVIGYIFGLFQTSFFIGLIMKKDLRTLGSGNLGATNAMRNLGKIAGAITYIFDAFKGFLACFLVAIIFKSYSDYIMALQLYAAVGAMLGHCFPVYLRFKGGKGVSTMTGAMLSINFLTAIIGLTIYFIVMVLSKYVSVGSIVMAFTYFLFLSIGAAFGLYRVCQDCAIHIIFMSTVMFCIIAVQHRSNLRRLAFREERKVGKNES